MKTDLQISYKYLKKNKINIAKYSNNSHWEIIVLRIR